MSADPQPGSDPLLDALVVELAEVHPTRVAQALSRARQAAPPAEVRHLRVVQASSPEQILEDAVAWWAMYQAPITVAQVLSTDRSQPVGNARRAAMWVVRESTRLSLHQMGRLFHRDHTSVLDACRRAREHEDPEVLAAMLAFAKSPSA